MSLPKRTQPNPSTVIPPPALTALHTGAAIRLCRERAGLQPSELAWRARVVQAYIRHWEEGSWMPSLHGLEKVAAGLGVSPWALLKLAYRIAAGESAE